MCLCPLVLSVLSCRLYSFELFRLATVMGNRGLFGPGRKRACSRSCGSFAAGEAASEGSRRRWPKDAAAEDQPKEGCREGSRPRWSCTSRRRRRDWRTSLSSMIGHSAQYIDAMEALPMPFELSEVKDSRTEMKFWLWRLLGSGGICQCGTFRS